jgi:predicted TIM-barrel fold metal-dependent hydrolase
MPIRARTGENPGEDVMSRITPNFAQSRREFLNTLAGASAGALCMASAIGAARAQPAPRREIVIGGKRIKTIDMHAHCIVPEVVAVLKGTPLEGRLGANGQSQGGIGALDMQRRFAGMDADGVDVQVLGINPFWYGTDRELARRIIDVQNEKLSEFVKSSGGRFEAYASVALQHPDLAAEQLEHGVKALGLKGGFIGCSVGEDELSAQKFDPFWAKAEELDVPITLHPQNSVQTTGIGKRVKGSGLLSNVIGNPLETSLALAHFIFQGTFDRFPRLKIVGVHGGGFLPSYAARMDHGCDVFPDRCKGPKLQKKPSDYLKQIYVDSLVFTGEGLRHLVAECGITQVVLGTDSPVPWVKNPVGHVMETQSLNDADRVAILHGNAARLLKIDA